MMQSFKYEERPSSGALDQLRSLACREATAMTSFEHEYELFSRAEIQLANFNAHPFIVRR